MDSKVILKVTWLPGTLVIILVSLFFWSNYTMDKLDKIVVSQTADQQYKQDLILSISELQNKLSLLDDRLNQYNDELFKLDEAIKAIKAVASLAGNHGVQLLDFKFDLLKYLEQKKQADGPGPFILPFEARFCGNYIKTGKFIQVLERKKYIRDINSIKLLNDGSGNNDVSCNIKGALRFFNRSELELTDNGQI